MPQIVQPLVPEMEALFLRFQKEKAVAAIRAEGTGRMLGDLRVSGIEAGVGPQFAGAKRRDQLIPVGTRVHVSILLEDRVYSARSVLLEPLISREGDTQFPPVLRLAWPMEAIQVYKRRDLRVAAPDQDPLPARIFVAGQWVDARLLNLTETGLGLGLPLTLNLALQMVVQVETELPGGRRLATTGEVRHLEIVEDDPLPTRLGMILPHLDEDGQEVLRGFVQERRTDRSESMRQGS